jgi:hypothetical protein
VKRMNATELHNEGQWLRVSGSGLTLKRRAGVWAGARGRLKGRFKPVLYGILRLFVPPCPCGNAHCGHAFHTSWSPGNILRGLHQVPVLP